MVKVDMATYAVSNDKEGAYLRSLPRCQHSFSWGRFRELFLMLVQDFLHIVLGSVWTACKKHSPEKFTINVGGGFRKVLDEHAFVNIALLYHVFRTELRKRR